MENFVHRENLKLYRKLLAETTDEQKRQTLLKLLSDEEAKDAQPSEKSGAEARFRNTGAGVNCSRQGCPGRPPERRRRPRTSATSRQMPI